MALTDTQLQKANDFFRTKGVKLQCPSCGTSEPPVVLGIKALVGMENQGIVLGGGGIAPLIDVVCTNCGYVRLYSAIAIGIVSNDDAAAAS